MALVLSLRRKRMETTNEAVDARSTSPGFHDNGVSWATARSRAAAESEETDRGFHPKPW